MFDQQCLIFRSSVFWVFEIEADLRGLSFSEAEQQHVMKISKTGAVDEDDAPYGQNGVRNSNGKPLDKYGIDTALDGSLRRSKKKKKKQQNAKPKVSRGRTREHQQEAIDRSRLAPMLDNATVQSPVCISVRLVHDFVSSGNRDFKVLQGETVIARFRRNENVFVQCFNGTYGFVPARFCYLLDVYPMTKFLDVNLAELLRPVEDRIHCDEISTNMERAEVKNCDDNVDECLLATEEQNPEQQMAGNKENDAAAIEMDSPQQTQPQTFDLQSQELNESDSLARRIKKHEIRQLLKRETSKKISNDNSTLPIGPFNNQEARDAPKEPIRSDLEISDNLIRQNSVECDNKIVSNGGLPASLRSSISSLQNQSVTGVNRMLRPIDCNSGKLQNGHVHPIDINMKVMQPALYEEDLVSNVLPSNGYFYNEPTEAMYTETEIQKIVDGRPRQYILSNRRCTSLRKVPNVQMKPPARANSLRYPSYGYENGVYPREMIASSNGSLPRTPGRFQVLNPNGLQHDDVTDTISINSLHSLNGSLHLNNSVQSVNGSLRFDNSIQSANCTVIAVRDFLSSSRDDLSFAKGERLLVIRKDSEGWWWVRNSKGQEGFAPCQFMAPIEKINGVRESPGPKRMPYIEDNISDGLSDRENHALNSSLVSLETQKLLESRLDWQRIYSKESGRLAVVMPSLRSNIEEEKDTSSVESKEELLKRIRSEIDRDPVRSHPKVNSMKNANFDENYNDEMGNISMDEKGYYRNMEEINKNKVYRSSVKLKLPSYTDYIVNKSNLNGHDDSDSHSFYSSSFSDVSNLDGSVYDTPTPRALRRRKTYSGTSNKKVRFSQSGNGVEVTSSEIPSMQCYIEKDVENSAEMDEHISKIQTELSTWC